MEREVGPIFSELSQALLRFGPGPKSHDTTGLAMSGQFGDRVAPEEPYCAVNQLSWPRPFTPGDPLEQGKLPSFDSVGEAHVEPSPTIVDLLKRRD